jgi:hypothetical protein
MVTTSLTEIAGLRERMLQDIEDMRRVATGVVSRPELYLGIRPRFLLIYQGLNDLPVLRAQEALLRTIAPPLFYSLPTAAATPPCNETMRIRVGFLSAHFRWHSVGRLLRGVITEMAAEAHRLSIFLIYPADSVAGEVSHALCTACLMLGPCPGGLDT